jgi:hypothetical protein
MSSLSAIPMSRKLGETWGSPRRKSLIPHLHSP